MDEALTFNADTFEEIVLRADVPVLVDVWAEGCGACRQLAPIINEIATELVGRARIGTLNALSNISIATRYEIRAVPALLIFNNGNLVDRRCGYRDASQIRAMLELYLGDLG